MTPKEINQMFDIDDYDFYYCDFERHPFNVARDLALWIVGNLNAEDIQHEPEWDHSHQFPTSYGSISGNKGWPNRSQSHQWTILANRFSAFGQGLFHTLTFAECDLDAFYAMKALCKERIEMMEWQQATNYQLDFQRQVLTDLDCLISYFAKKYPTETIKILKGERVTE
jgi:hypothetical protein